LNQRPSGPQPDALPNCATPRSLPEFRAGSVLDRCEHAFAVRDCASTQKCYRCGEEKHAEDFAWRRKEKGQRDSHCRPCRSAYGREHYEANRQRYIDQAAASKRKLRLARTKYLIEFFKTHPCVECGETDPVVLEFDHLRDKLFAIGPELSRKRWQSILDEIEKCEVVCANCHRRRTARRRGALRAILAGLQTGEARAGDRD
jgi:hypothetical protein